MKLVKCTAGLLVAAICLAGPVSAQGPAKSATGTDAAMTAAINNAMTPGAGQKRLDPMIGTFSVKIRTWVTPESAPVESSGTSVNVWVLGGRYVQSMLVAQVAGQPFSGIGYMAFDNVTKKYQATWLDNGSTAFTWYEGSMDASGKTATMKATTANPLTARAEPVELRLSIAPNGDHVTEVWGLGAGAKLVKLMELDYTKSAGTH